MNEAPRKIEVHFVQNDIDPTGLGEPPFPPVFGAVANALYQAAGERFYQQPFGPQLMNQTAPDMKIKPPKSKLKKDDRRAL